MSFEGTMTTTAVRRIALGAVPAVIAAGALAGCNDAAPTVQPPPATSQGSDQPVPTQGSVPTQSSVPTDSEVPTVSAAPSSATGDPAKVCTAEDDGFLTPGALAPSTRKAAWGKPLELSQKYGGTVTITPQVPQAKKPADGDIFGPPDGQTNLLVKVTVAYKSGDESTIAGIYFTLRDSQKNLCDYSSLSQAVPKQDQFDDATLSKTSRTYTGTMVFEAPAGQDYTKYTLLYRPSTFDNKSSDAPVAWTD